MPSVVCGGATFHVRKRTFHAPAVRFMRQSRVVWLFYVVARGRGVSKRQLMSIWFVN